MDEGDGDDADTDEPILFEFFLGINRNISHFYAEKTKFFLNHKPSEELPDVV